VAGAASPVTLRDAIDPSRLPGVRNAILVLT
jgi:hypothetical protein